MRPATRRLFCVGLLAVLMLGCAWGVYDSRRPVPDGLLEAAGRVESARIAQRRGRDDEIYFRLAGWPQEFSYHQGLPRVEQVMARLRVGSRVELRLGPRGSHDIWALRLDGHELLRPDDRLQSLRAGGYVAAALLLGAAALALWLWRAMAPRG